MYEVGREINHILACIPQRQAQQLRAHLKPTTLTLGQILYEPGEAVRQVYFPINSLISLLTEVDKHRSLAVGMVGNEGMAGTQIILGVGVSGGRAIVQGAGVALTMASAPFCLEFDRNQFLQKALFRYAYALIAQISQTAACNRFHGAEARLARWLLMTRERVGSDEFMLTHAFLAHMLGLRREGVTEAASALRDKKLIEYSRGRIRIVDVGGLSKACCSCYETVRFVYERAQRNRTK